MVEGRALESGNGDAALDGAGLLHALVGEREVPAQRHKRHAGGVGVYTVDGYHTVAGEVAVECHAGIGVG